MGCEVAAGKLKVCTGAHTNGAHGGEGANEVRVVIAVQEELEGELAQEAASGGWLSDPSQLDRYAALKLEADAKTSKLASERSTAATKLQARPTTSPPITYSATHESGSRESLRW